ncbi:hypothetical protein DICPUDRAFT_77691 [Dictyostelium purpureum]|uniref:Uncharacterized protein n=1 Tax=Dictyostelium purpureum TaxID=5786 RepID=F0ZHC7_DICPU|nr:uncharacterized protein DICPUDRAFT_77691 [Dictyostelium purpureum]EGC36647.1 hypothetical protein DICPUDRAFT_77691 [Dictyostelium purpureum]|eukprot:XP_003286815.1 hypothetical protein DICPUDRAFT_77691 [Dictyostelium purpureum]
MKKDFIIERLDAFKLEFDNFQIRDYNYKYCPLNQPHRKLKVPLKTFKAIGNFPHLLTKENPPRPSNVKDKPNPDLFPKTVGDVFGLREIDFARLSMFYNEDFGIETSNTSIESWRYLFFEWLGCNIFQNTTVLLNKF